jgi:hypothetical protein
VTADCASTRGEWGCGERLPERPKGPPSERIRRVIRWNLDGPEWSASRKAAYEGRKR